MENASARAETKNHRRVSAVFFLFTLTLFACASPSLHESQVQERVPQTAEEYFERGYARLGEDDSKGAIQAFTRAIQLDPKEARYYRARARVYHVLENKEGALADYSAAIELTPQAELARTSFFQKSLYELRAAVRKELKQYRGAAEDLTKLVELNPESFRPYVQRAEIHELEGNLDAAIEDMTRAIELGQSPFLYSRRAQLQERKGDVDGAIADCMRALQAHPKNSLCSRYLAQQSGEIGVAREGPPERKKAEVASSEVKGPNAEVSPRVAKPAEPPRAIPEPPPAQGEAEKPAPKPLTEVTKPDVKREKRYTLQVATLVVERNALTLKKRLEELGYTPIVRMTTAPITHHRVFGGEFSSREEAEQTAGRLNADGFSTNLVELEDGKFGPEVGSYFSLNEAIDLARRLEKKNYRAKIVSEVSSTTVHQVRVGEYENRVEARKALEALKRKGFAPLIVRR